MLSLKVSGSLLVAAMLLMGLARGSHGQRESERDSDDFDDNGFDDSGYSQPSRDAEGSHNEPSRYSPSSEEDLDDDDDADDTRNVLVKVIGPRQFGSSARSVVLPALNKQSGPTDEERDIESAASRPLSRQKRYAKKRKHYTGPVYTYVKTDKLAHYKWGVKHKVGKQYG